MSKRLEQAIAVLNGAMGDYLARRGNGLATDLTLVRAGAPLAAEAEVIARAYPAATPRVVLLVHGLMCTESIFELPGGGDYGSLLERDLGFTPLYVRYNSGRAIAESGADLGALLERVVAAFPVEIEEIVLVGFSMGGLVVRSACHAGAGRRWLELVTRAVYLGTPHRGAPLERGGRALAKLLAAIPDPYTRLAADLADLRSEGIKDLGDPRHPVPLLPSIRHYLVAGTVSANPWLTMLFGDSLVPVGSATDGLDLRGADRLLPANHVRILPGAKHVSLAHDPYVYDAIRAFMETP
jgi:pimeloyl-ACP methyl ester carboxylesterase